MAVFVKTEKTFAFFAFLEKVNNYELVDCKGATRVVSVPVDTHLVDGCVLTKHKKCTCIPTKSQASVSLGNM
jgi:hypothetical protein